jgi:hypothetical protein
VALGNATTDTVTITGYIGNSFSQDGTGDVCHYFRDGGTLRWAVGLDATDESFNIATSSDFATNNIMTCLAGGVVFNETGDDRDFRIESNDEPNMFIIDAGANQVQIGTTGNRIGNRAFVIQADVDDYAALINNNGTNAKALYIQASAPSDAATAILMGAHFTSATTNNLPYYIYFSNEALSPCASIRADSSEGAAYTNHSDARSKTDVEDFKGGLEKISAMQPRRFKWKKTGKPSCGFIAQELQPIFPEAVFGKPDDDHATNPMGVSFERIVIPLVAAVKELIARVEALEAKN